MPPMCFAYLWYPTPMVHILPSLALKSRPLSRPQGTPFLLSDLLRSRASVFRQELVEKMKAARAHKVPKRSDFDIVA